MNPSGWLRRLLVGLRLAPVWSFLLLLPLAAALWFLAPSLSFDGAPLLPSKGARGIAIGSLLLLWAMLMLSLRAWSARRRRNALEPLQREQREALEAQSDEEQQVLRQRFRDALRTLSSAGLYRGLGRRGRAQLPWYLLIGPPASGKTSLLEFSGLDFPLEAGQHERLTRDMGGTRHAHWYFAEHAVLIDTAGDYLTQPEPQVQGRAWQTLLGLLRKRAPRALNGVLVTLSVEQLLDGDELALESLARQVRQRLLEVHQRLACEVPVYLVLSKTDRIAGFDEFFDLLTREESAQVLGATFTPGQDGTAQGVLGNALGELLQRLNAQVVQRIHQERDCLRRGLVLDFPRQLAQLGERLCLFVELAFSGNRYQRASSLRGFYFTSAPHLSESLDPLTSGIGRQLGMPRDSLPSLRQGRARFIGQLLDRVIFPESDLAALNQSERRRIVWRQRSLVLGIFACLGVLGGTWAYAFSANQGRLEQLRGLLGEWGSQREALPAGGDARSGLALLDTAFAAQQLFPEAEAVPHWQRAGLYQGAAVTTLVQPAYREELQRVLLPRVLRQLEDNIRHSLDDRGRLLDNLRAYLMLRDVERRDVDFLQRWLMADWSRRYPADGSSQASLAGHFARLLAAGFEPAQLDESLLAKAREVLRGESLAGVFYRLLQARASGLPEYSLGSRMGAQAGLFAGADGRIPGLYTAAGYRDFFQAQGRALVRDAMRDDWVLGASEGLSGADFERLYADIEQLYLRDYAEHWGQAIGRLTLRPAEDLQQLAQTLAGLTAANSPLLHLLAEVQENTRLVVASSPLEPSPSGALEAAGEAPADSEAVELSSAGQSLARRFEALRNLLDEQGGARAELLALLQALDAWQLRVDSLAHAGAADQAAYEMARERMGGRGTDALGQVRSATARLPQPLAGWFTHLAQNSWQVVLDGAQRYLNERYRGELYGFYRKSLRQRYPFDADSDSEVSLGDFREFFKADGVAAHFIERYLAPFVSQASGGYRARQVDGNGLSLSREFLGQLQRLRTIRESFFAEDASEPQVSFRLEPYALDSSLGRADFRFAGQRLEYRHGPIVQTAFVWPGDSDDGRSSLVVEELGGRRLGIERSGGPWSLFRLFDQLHAQQHSGRDVLMLRADIDGRQADYLLHSQRSPNPFDTQPLRRFRLPAVL